MPDLLKAGYRTRRDLFVGIGLQVLRVYTEWHYLP